MYTPEHKSKQKKRKKKKKYIYTITCIHKYKYIYIKKLKNEYKYIIILHILSIPVCPRSYRIRFFFALRMQRAYVRVVCVSRKNTPA